MNDEFLIAQASTLADTLLQQDIMLATAESCTGGGISHLLTSLPGSSTWFERGFVTYSNEAKQDMLGVSALTLEKHGAVSEECAAEMAAGAVSHSRAEVAVSVTGIAGPGGGSPGKPVGTVCFGWCRREAGRLTAVHVFEGDREAVRQQSISMAIQGLIELLDTR